MWGREWQVKKEPIVLGLLSDLLHRLFCQFVEHLNMLKIVADRGLAPELESPRTRCDSIRHTCDAVILKIHMRVHVERCGNTEKIIEAKLIRTQGDGL